MAYDLDFRRRAVSLLEEGFTLDSVSKLLNVGTASLTRWKQRAAQDNLAAHYPKFRGTYKLDESALKAYLKENPDAYLDEIAEAIGSKRSTVWDALERLKITRKKRRRNIAKGTKKSAAFMKKY